MKKILAFSGSNSSKSINQTLVKLVADKIENHQVEVIDIRDYPMPIYSSDIEENEGYPENARIIRNLLADHDAFVIASPEHNGSMPVAFKNLIDWVSRLGDMENPMFGDKKPLLLLSTSPGPTGGATNLANLANLMPWWGADVRGTYNLGSFYDNFVDGKLSPEKDQELTNLVTQFTAQL
ncbi:MAG: NAD(P)H-dependent oxidoreductase [Amphritea sp.]